MMLAPWTGTLAFSLLSAQLPAPPKGEYVCTQTSVVAAPSVGGMITTMVQTLPSGFGNLVLDGAGRYHMSLGNREPASYVFEPATGRVMFAGFLQAFTNNYSTNGRTVSFDFRAKNANFSCGLTGARDYGRQTAGAPAAPAAGERKPRPLAGKLYVGTRAGVVRVDLATGAETLISSAFDFDVRGPEVLVVRQGELLLTNDDGAGSKKIPVYGSKNEAPRFSPDRQRVVYLGNQKPQDLSAAILGAYTSALQEPLVVTRDGRLLAALGTAYTQPAWTPDGRLVLAGTKGVGSLAGDAAAGIYLTDARWRNLKRIDPDFDAPHSPAVSPDGRQVAFVNGARIWVMPLDGSAAPRKWFEGNSRFLAGLAWSPDGKFLAFADNQTVKAVTATGALVPVEDKDGNGFQASTTLVWME